MNETAPGGVSRWRRWSSLIVLVTLFGIVIAFAAGQLQAYQITTESMEPTIMPGDHLLVYVRKPPRPKRGDIVAVHNPKNPSEGLCKRVVALPTDLVEIRRGTFYLNGMRQDREREPSDAYIPVANLKSLLQPNEYFVLGDNRPASVDSSEFGPVHGEDFIGVAICIYWPPGRVRSLRVSQGYSGIGGGAKTASE
jgi:signal peptidase I